MRRFVYSDSKMAAAVTVVGLFLVAVTGAGENGAFVICIAVVTVALLVRVRIEDRDAERHWRSADALPGRRSGGPKERSGGGRSRGSR